MALARPKRKCASTAGDKTLSPNTPLDVDATVSRSTSKPVKKRRKKEIAAVEAVNQHPASTYKTPNNP
jgi:hypothetical protein